MNHPNLHYLSPSELERLDSLNNIFSIVPHSSSIFGVDSYHLSLPYLDPSYQFVLSITKTYEPVNQIVSFVVVQLDLKELSLSVINSFTNLELSLHCLEQSARNFLLSLEQVT